MTKPTGRKKRRSGPRRKTIGATVRVVATEPRRTVRANPHTFLRLYLPNLSFDPWKTSREWTAGRPKFLAGVALILIVIAISQLFTMPQFFVDGVRFTGNRILTPDELNQAAAVRSWSVFFVDPREVERTLEALPEVKQARVTVALPNVVQAQVVERLPRMVWETGGKTYWVDDDGIAQRARTSIPGILWLKDLDAAPVSIGQRINPEAFNALVSLRNLWPDGPTVFEWSRHRGLAAREGHGWPVYFGRSSQMPDKLQALKVITEQIVKEGKIINFIDLSSGLPYYQEAAAKSTTSN